MLPNLSKCAPSAATGASPKTGHILELRTETATTGVWPWSETPLEKARKVLTRHLTKDLVYVLENGSNENSHTNTTERPLDNLSQTDKRLLVNQLQKTPSAQRNEIRNAIDVYIRHLLNEFSMETHNERAHGEGGAPGRNLQFAKILRFLSIQNVVWNPDLSIAHLTRGVEEARKSHSKIDREFTDIIKKRKDVQEEERAVKLSVSNANARVANVQSQLDKAQKAQHDIESTYETTQSSTVDYARLLLHEIVTLYHVELQQPKDGDTPENALERYQRRIHHASQFFGNNEEFNNAVNELSDTQDQDNKASVGDPEWGTQAKQVATRIVDIVNLYSATERTKRDYDALVTDLKQLWAEQFGNREKTDADKNFFDATFRHVKNAYGNTSEEWTERIYNVLCLSYYGQDCQTTMALQENLEFLTEPGPSDWDTSDESDR